MNKTLVKICGITNPDDASIALECGADMLGFIFYEKSPRFINPENAGKIISGLKIKYKFKSVGVFVNTPAEYIEDVIRISGLDILQFHGEESPSFIQQFNREKIKAFRIKDGSEIINIKKYSSADFFLLDTFSMSAYGGTGEVFNWDILTDIDFRDKLFLSGGISSSNVIEAVNVIRPYALDLCSSLEKEPGIKDRDKLVNFFSIIKNIN